MTSQVHRSFLTGTPLLAVGLFLTMTIGGLAQQGNAKAKQKKETAPDAAIYKLVNKTSGKFTDEQCFWSLNGGRDWHSFAKEPTVPIPSGGGGRVYFYLGTKPKNFDDRQAYWDFIEHTFGKGTWHGNTTQVDAFCIPLTIEMGSQKVGITESRSKLFETFRKEAPKEFKDCVQGDFWILSPCRAGFGKNGPHAHYFDNYVDEVWEMYAQEKKTPSGKYIGKVVQGALTFTPVEGGKVAKPFTCAKKPSTQDIFLGEGVLSNNPAFAGAFNRHVAADPADWKDPAKFYQAEPCNWYAKFFHEHSIDHKAYGFSYDDASEQAPFFSGKGSEVIVTIYWDTPSK
jgi:hypothetical protein